jgi:hypothetical protein
VSSAWFGLIGVVVGGLIASVWSWLALVRQELSDGMVAARLVDEDLTIRQKASEQGDEAGGGTTIWKENRVALARVLSHPKWEAVSTVYTPAPHTPDELFAAAHVALLPLVQGKRYPVPERWQDKLLFWRR